MEKDGNTRTKWTPCAPDDPDAKKMTWNDLDSSDDLEEPPVTLVINRINRKRLGVLRGYDCEITTQKLYH